MSGLQGGISEAKGREGSLWVAGVLFCTLNRGNICCRLVHCEVLLFLHFELNVDDGLKLPLQFFSLVRVLQPWGLYPGCVEQFWGQARKNQEGSLSLSPHIAGGACCSNHRVTRGLYCGQCFLLGAGQGSLSWSFWGLDGRGGWQNCRVGVG